MKEIANLVKLKTENWLMSVNMQLFVMQLVSKWRKQKNSNEWTKIIQICWKCHQHVQFMLNEKYSKTFQAMKNSTLV